MELFDALSGSRKRLALGNKVLRCGCDSRRGKYVAEALKETLAYLGYSIADGGNGLYCGEKPPRDSAQHWLKVGALKGSCDDDVLHFLCLKIHYRKDLEVTPALEAAARRELSGIRDAIAFLDRHQPGTAGNLSALAVYKKRHREALADDMNLPEALDNLLAALRPGALSPGSQREFLRGVEPVLRLRAV